MNKRVIALGFFDGVHLGHGALLSKTVERAAELGCVNTHFVTTNGLSAEGHYSSAYDLYLITAEAIKHPEFLKIANTLSYLPTSEAVNAGETMYNSNALLHEAPAYPGDYIYEYASGVKTGYTRAAGRTLVSCAEQNGQRLVAVTLQDGNDWTGLMVQQEELKTMPFGEVWAEYCRICNVPCDGTWLPKVKQYEHDVLSKRSETDK